jgi:hypothetical protein
MRPVQRTLYAGCAAKAQPARPIYVHAGWNRTACRDGRRQGVTWRGTRSDSAHPSRNKNGPEETWLRSRALARSLQLEPGCERAYVYVELPTEHGDEKIFDRSIGTLADAGSVFMRVVRCKICFSCVLIPFQLRGHFPRL